ncbi:phosphatidate cytidylyltransferase [Candidatus Pelagibacter sp.]|nr:phosphatidate cytidylyltransferase [Candidatus Pelagibacter sp.]
MISELEKRILSSFIILPISLFFIFKGFEFFAFFLGIIFLITSYEWLTFNKKKFFTKLIGLIFLLFSFYSAYLFRQEYGFYFFLVVVFISIFTDLGGYFFGKFFKGPKLTKISPNKTYSGVFGSFLLSIIGGIFLIKIFSINNIVLSIKGILDISIIIFIISLISQLGDLIISYFKRKAKVKDTGKILPGHGGLLDRVDGIIFAVPFSYLIANYFNL